VVAVTPRSLVVSWVVMVRRMDRLRRRWRAAAGLISSVALRGCTATGALRSVFVLGGICIGTYVAFLSAIVRAEPSPSPMRIWSVPGDAWGVPAADSSAAFFLSKQHAVVAVDAETGRVRWRRRTAVRDDPTSGKRVLLAGPVIVAGDYDIFGLDRDDGTIRWRFSPTDGYGPGLYVGLVAGGVVFAGSPSGRLYALSATSGDLLWSALVGSAAPTTVFEPVAADGVVFAGFTVFATPMAGGVVAVDAATGLKVWQTAFPTPSGGIGGAGWAGGPVVVGDLVLCANSRGDIVAVARNTGRLRWIIDKTSSSVQMPERDFRALAAAGDLLVAGSLSGYVIAYDMGSRKERWHSSTAAYGSVALSLAQDEQAIYVPYMGGRMVALDISTGKERWTTDVVLGRIFWPPAISGNRLFASGETSFMALHR